MEKLIANLATSKITERTLKGTKYIVAPVSMIVEGVWPGSQGAVYYEGGDIARSVPAWNHKPITIGHPTLPDGTQVSGTSPEALEKHSVGLVLNTRFNKKTKKLQAEAWFEVDRLSKVDGGEIIHSALLANHKLEVSTGLFVDALIGNGSFNDKSYVAKATNYRPDHLAIILSGEGACSLKDGAGLLVNKAVKPSRPEAEPQLIGNAKNLSEIVDKVRESVYQTHEVYRDEEPSTYAYVEAIYDSYVIFSTRTSGESATFKQNYAMENDSVKLLGEVIPVVRKVTYSVQNKKDNMERQELIKKLGDTHAEFVTNMSEDVFKAIEKVFAQAASAPVAPVAPAEVKPIVCNSVEELLEHASEGVKNQINDAVTLAVSTRNALIEKIVANSKDQFTKDELASFTTAHLNKLATVIGPASVKTSGNAVYAGEAFVGNQSQGQKGQAPATESVPVPPSTFVKSK
jgi:hypothetical protein